MSSGRREATALEGGWSAERFQGVEALERLDATWRELHALGGSDALCNSFEFNLAYAQAWLAPNGKGAPFGWVLRDRTGQAMALLPFRREPSRGFLALPRVMLLADGTFDGDYLDLLVRPGAERQAARAAIQLLADDGGHQALLLGCVPAESTVLGMLQEVAHERNLPYRMRDIPCAAMELASDFDGFLASLPKRMRSKVRQAVRRAQAAGALARWCTDRSELQDDLDALFELHTRRWAQVGQSGSFGESRRRQFYLELCAALAAKGQLRLARMDCGGRRLAVQVGALIDGTYYQLQEGYDPEFDAFRPGVALRGWGLQALIEQGARRYDFMGGHSRHKSDWGADLRQARTLALSLPRLRARVAYGLRAAIDRRRGDA